MGKDERGYLQVDVLGVEMAGLLDCGSTRTLVGWRGSKYLEAVDLKLHPSKYTTLKVADQGTSGIEGEFQVPFNVCGKIRLVPVLYAPCLSSDLILGLDFWRRYHLIPDFVNNTCTVSSAIVEIIERPPEVQEECLNSRQQEELQNLLEEFRPILQPGKLGCVRGVFHTINIKDGSKPFKETYYSLNPRVMAAVHQELDRRLENDIVEPADSAFQSPLIIIPKKDQGFRWVVDLRKLNDIIAEPDSSYPLPRINPLVTCVKGASILSTIDISDAYLQILLSPQSRPLTAFYVPGRGQYQYKRMPAGLKDAASRWQRTIEEVLRPVVVEDPHCVYYMDDILVWSEDDDWDHHYAMLRKVFQRLADVGITVNLSKSHFAQRRVKYLGHMIDEYGVRPDPGKVAAVLNFPTPKNVTNIRQFVGLAGWMRKFVPNFSIIAKPLYDRMKKGKAFVWGTEEEVAFVNLKQLLCKEPVLRCPDFERPFKVYTDACSFGTGAILTQVFDDGEHAIAYTSKKLKTREQNYSATELELLAVLHAVEAFRPYLEGYKFEVITDHSSLKWLHKLKNPTGRLARWAVQLQQYNMEITHRKGSSMQAPDALSRNPVEVSLVDFPPDVKDPWYVELVHKVRKDPEDYGKFAIHDDKLFKLVTIHPALPLKWVQVVPREVRAELLHQCHDVPTSGHGGVFRTLQRLRNQGYWPNMKEDVVRYVNTCQTCQRIKKDRRKPPGLMSSKAVVSRPMEYLSADLIGPLPMTRKKAMYISVITDTFSKYVFVRPIKKASSAAVMNHLKEDVILKHGAPKVLQMDNANQYSCHDMKKLCREYNITPRYNIAYTARNNPTERMNQTLETLICSYVQDDHRTWDEHLPELQAALNTSVSVVTGLSPHQVLFGESLILDGRERQFNGCEDPVVEDPLPEDNADKEDRLEFFEELRDKIQQAKQANANRFNARRRPADCYDAGDMVWRRQFVKSNKAKFISKKLASPWTGPFKIKQKVGRVSYLLEDDRGKEDGPWHVEQLKKHRARRNG